MADILSRASPSPQPDELEALRAAKEYAESIVETIHEPLLVLTPELRVKTANPAFCDQFRVSPEETVGRLVYELGNGQWDIPDLRRLLEDVLPEDHVFNDFVVRHEFAELGPRVMLLNGRRLDHVQLVLLGIRDVTEEARVRGALRESEERLRRILDHLPLGVGMLDSDGGWTFKNKVMEGLVSDVMPSRDPGVRPHWRAWDENGELLEPAAWPGERALRGETVHPGMDLLHTAGDGAERWVRVTTAPFLSLEGRIVGAVAAAEDITDVKSAEEKLRESEASLWASKQLLESVIEGSSDLVAAQDTENRYIAFNQAYREAFREVFDVDLEIGSSMVDVLAHQPDAQRHAMDLWAEALRGETVLVTSHFTFPRQGRRWFEMSFGPIRDREGDTVGAVEVARDVTERVRAEKALRESQERFRRSVEGLLHPFGIYSAVRDEGGEIRDFRVDYANKEACRLDGRVREEYVGRTLRELYPGGEADDLVDWYRHVVETGEPSVRRSIPSTPTVPPGTATRYFDISVSPIGDGFAAAWQEVTERVRYEEQLESRVAERTREVRELAQTLSMAEQDERQRLSHLLHDDLQQLLYGVQMKLLLARQAMDREDLEIVRDQADRSLALLDDAIRRTRQLTVDLNPPILEGEGLVEALEWLRTHMRDLHGLEVEIDAPEAVEVPRPELRILLFQITRELLFNTAKHADTDRAAVEVTAGQNDVRVAVRDHGKGFDPAAVSGKRGRRGGLGLLSARERLRMYGGDLEVHSRPGGGVRVVMRAPLTVQG